jgi:phospholipid/cholesterol/gamma-HCH transport system substrate-binding protein
MKRIIVSVAVGAALVGIFTLAFGGFSKPYQVSVLLPNAANLFEGGSVMQNGNRIGTIKTLGVENNGARVTFELEDWAAPLHDGVSVRVTWKAVLGERLLDVTDGPEQNATIPSGGMLKGQMQAPVEIDQVLAALDPDTRTRLNSLVSNLKGTLGGRESDINATLRKAGPALQAAGGVLRGLGTDGQAINQVVKNLNDTLGILARRDQSVQGIVQSLSDTTGRLVSERKQIGESLQLTPATLRQAQTTLGNVPGVVDKASPLLDDLAPATSRLPAVSANLRLLFNDLRPTVADLRPTLSSAADLLKSTPDLLDAGRETLPEIDDTLKGIAPALNYLRPYAPELAGFLANWGSANGNIDANGHYVRIYVQGGLESGNVNPGVTAPGDKKTLTPMPGELVNQPWADAFGSGMK